MHLFMFLTMRNPGAFMRAGVALSQVAFVNVYMLMYLMAPNFAHRFVGYLEEEAVHTYTKALEAIDDGRLPSWKIMKAPVEAVEYYGLNPETATVRDLILSVRADEAVHRSVNHHFSDVPQHYHMEADALSIKDVPTVAPSKFLMEHQKKQAPPQPLIEEASK